MTSTDTEAMHVLQALLEERQRYEGWLRALESRQATTPAHVFTRVHTDYSLRLERVMQRLSEQTEELRSTIDIMTTQLATLRGKEADRIDVRQEAELRAAVGEYGDEEWARLRGEADREIEAIATERRGLETELTELERIIVMTRPAAQQSEPAPPAETGSSPAQGTSAVPPVAESTDDAPSIDNFVADWPVRHVVSAPAAQGDGVAEVPEVDDARAAPVTAAAPEPGVPTPASSFAASSMPEIQTIPAMESRRDQEKALKCPECGAMNYATEWYCERCGGELATF